MHNFKSKEESKEVYFSGIHFYLNLNSKNSYKSNFLWEMLSLKSPLLKVKKNTLNQTFENLADEKMMDG